MPPKLTVDAAWLANAISDSLDRYEAMRQMPTNTDADRAALLGAFRSWDERNQRLLEQSFTPVAWHESSPKSDYATIKDLEFALLDEISSEQAPILGRLADEKKRRLESLLDSLDIYQREAVDVGALDQQMSADDAAAGGDAQEPAIFLVHGRDRGAREEVHRFLERTSDARVIVLSEQPNRGQTIIEKLESHLPATAYVVVLATADDEGRLRGEDQLSFRARQNVILELGYAIGQVGRRNVTLLYEDGVELPSDYYGVGYIGFDAGGGWKLQLIAELKAAGFSVDANRALG